MKKSQLRQIIKEELANRLPIGAKSVIYVVIDPDYDEYDDGENPILFEGSLAEVKEFIFNQLEGDALEGYRLLKKSEWEGENNNSSVLKESGIITIGSSISKDLTEFLNNIVIPKSKGYVKNEKDAAALLLDIIKFKYKF